eukprot:4867077-Prymnesium_polylepis.1
MMTTATVTTVTSASKTFLSERQYCSGARRVVWRLVWRGAWCGAALSAARRLMWRGAARSVG